jgi:DNA processing protein
MSRVGDDADAPLQDGGVARARAIDARTRAWAVIAHCDLPQPALLAALRAAGDPEALVAPGALPRGVDATTRAALAAVTEADLAPTLKWLAAPSHRLLALDDPGYPQALYAIGDTPPVLFALGDVAILERPAVAIVGSRRATPQGLEDARAFARALAAAGVCVVSGLAQGIDAAAHEGALGERGSTIAVVGTGLDRVYPAVNRKLAHAIAERGLVLSEFVPGTPPLKWHFPRRNRLISGLARGVLVVEAGVSSGSLITARLAGEQGREVMAIPGSIHSPLAKGCHRLIREGAKLVETVDDVLAEIGLARRGAGARDTPGILRATPDAAQVELLDAMGVAPVDVDRLVRRTGWPVATIAATLTALEIDGHVTAMPGGQWQRRV